MKRTVFVICACLSMALLISCGNYSQVTTKSAEDGRYIGDFVTLKTDNEVFLLDENGNHLPLDYREIIVKDIFTNKTTYYIPVKPDKEFGCAIYDTDGTKITDYDKYVYSEYSVDGCLLRAKANNFNVKIGEVEAELWNPKTNEIIEKGIFSLQKLNDYKVIAIGEYGRLLGIINSSAEKIAGFPLENECYAPHVRNGYIATQSELTIEMLEKKNDDEANEPVTDEEEEEPIEDEIDEEESGKLMAGGGVVINIYDSELNFITSFGNEDEVLFDSPITRGDYILVRDAGEEKICSLKDGQTVFSTEGQITYADKNVVVVDDTDGVYIANHAGEALSDVFDMITDNNNGFEDYTKEADKFIARNKNKLCTLNTSGKVTKEVTYTGVSKIKAYDDIMVIRSIDIYGDNIFGTMNMSLEEIIAPDIFTDIVPLEKVYGSDRAPDDFLYCKYIDQDDFREYGAVVKNDGNVLVNKIIDFVPVKSGYFAIELDNEDGFMNYNGNWEKQNIKDDALEQ